MKKVASLFIASLLLLTQIVGYAQAQAQDISISNYKPGVTVEADDNSPTGYTVTFVYEGDADIEKVVLYSDTFMLWDEQAPQFIEEGIGMNLNNVSDVHKATYGHQPGDYKPTYWTGGGSGSSRFDVELTKVEGENLWYTQVPLTSGAFVYNYAITKDGVTTARLDDPSNPSMVNTATGVRSLSSLVYVPYNAEKQGVGPYKDRSIELPRTDGKQGVVETITYPSLEGEDRGMTVYLPYGYDKNRDKPYNVLYINMGNSGDKFGNEMRWMHEGVLPNIVDNLVAAGKEPFIAVSMNYQDWGHEWEKIEEDVIDHVLPFVESNYNVSSDRLGRGYAGLSMGAGTTANFYLNHPDKFSQFGIWSNGVIPEEAQLENVAKYKGETTVHIALAKWDFVTTGREMSNILNASGIPHYFNEIPGGHDWELWQLLLAEFAENYLWVTKASDVPADHWAKEAVDRALTSNLVGGYPDGTFKPQQTITRAEFVSMLTRAVQQQDTVNTEAPSFKDAKGHWAEANLATAVAQGWIAGYDDQTLRPDQTISRAEMAAIAARAWNLDTSEATPLSFSDASDIPTWAQASVAAAVDAGIISGRNAQQFDPLTAANRAEAVSLLIAAIDHAK